MTVAIDTVCLIVIAVCSVILTIHLTQVGGVIFTAVAALVIVVGAAWIAEW